MVLFLNRKKKQPKPTRQEILIQFAKDMGFRYSNESDGVYIAFESSERIVELSFWFEKEELVVVKAF